MYETLALLGIWDHAIGKVKACELKTSAEESLQIWDSFLACRYSIKSPTIVESVVRLLMFGLP